MADVLVVQSKVKEFLKSKGCNTSSEVAASLSKAVADLLNKGVERCKANGRKTVKGTDL